MLKKGEKKWVKERITIGLPNLKYTIFIQNSKLTYMWVRNYNNYGKKKKSNATRYSACKMYLCFFFLISHEKQSCPEEPPLSKLTTPLPHLIGSQLDVSLFFLFFFWYYSGRVNEKKINKMQIFFFQPKNLANAAVSEWLEAQSNGEKNKKKKQLSLNLVSPLRGRKFE